MSYLQHMAEDRRLMILRLLKRSGISANDRVLLAGIQEAGHRRVTLDLVREDLEWLREAGLVTHDWPSPTLLVAKLTRRGGDVADGAVTVAGVKVPDPYDDDA